MEYYNAIKGIEHQKQQCVAYINQALGNMYKVYDYYYLIQQMDAKDSVLKYYSLDNYPDLHFRTTDPAAFTDLGGTLENTKQVIFNYMQQLKLIGQSARELILFLREKYNIKE